MNTFVTADRRISIPLDDLVGTFRRFGPYGPCYEIVSVPTGHTGTDVVALIRVVESGEELDYPIRDIIDDPIAE